MDGDFQGRSIETRQDEGFANWRPQTRAVRGGLRRSDFEETSEALFLTSGYVFLAFAYLVVCYGLSRYSRRIELSR